MSLQHVTPLPRLPDPVVLRPGDVIYPWKVVRLVSRGGMGDIYEVRHAYLKHPAALKLLRAEYADSASAVSRIQLEARTGAYLRHPNLNLVFDGGEHHGQPYFLMELLDGKNLREWLCALGPFAIPDAIFVAMEVCAGLEALHAQARAIHRDVKPENIFVTYDGAVKLLDLGGAKYSDRGLPSPITKSNEGIGTVAYMAPEQIDKKESFASDLYALGTILYELISGKHPHVDIPNQWPADHELIRSHLLEEPTHLSELVSDCSDSLAALVASCLAKSPEDRPPSAWALRNRLGDELDAWERSHADFEWVPGALFRSQKPASSQRPMPALTPPRPRLAVSQGTVDDGYDRTLPTLVLTTRPRKTAQTEAPKKSGRPLGHRLRAFRWAIVTASALLFLLGYVLVGTKAGPTAVAPSAAGPPSASASAGTGSLRTASENGRRASECVASSPAPHALAAASSRLATGIGLPGNFHRTTDALPLASANPPSAVVGR